MRTIKATFVAAALLAATGSAAQITVLTRATVIDGTGAPAHNDYIVLMENGRISALRAMKGFRGCQK